MKAVWLLCCCCILFLTVKAQQKEHRIAALANPRTGSIQLRWSPTSYIAWQIGVKYGYTVERMTVVKDGQVVLHPVPVLLTTTKPATLGKMEQLSEKDERVGMIAELIYGDNDKKTKPEEGIGAYYDNQSQNEWRLAMALLVCDLNPLIASSAGLYMEDSTARPGERYAYRISVARQPHNLIIDTAYVVTSLQEKMLLSRPPELVVSSGDSTITLGWITSFTKGMYSAYMVERGSDGKHFNPVSDLPVLPTAPDKSGFSYYLDSIPDNDIRYYYRIRGITPFGEYGPYSKIVMGMGVPAVADRPVMDTVITEKNTIILQWSISKALKNQLSSLVITRSPNGSGNFTELGTIRLTGDTVYTFTDNTPLNSNYYRIKGITRRGKPIYSFPYFAQLIDSIPPDIPQELAGLADSTGIVKLHWRKNTEPDLQGYRVFRANSTKEEFVEVTRQILNTPVFKDTINLHTLTPKVYYKVIAVDKSFNTSGYSAYIELKRPDTIAPSSPVITGAVMIDSLKMISLQWINSSSTDVVKYTLYSVNSKDNARRLVAAWDSTNHRDTYADSLLTLGNTYYYELTAYDDAGNKATERSGDIFYETGKRPPLNAWKAVLDKKQIKLSWGNNSDVKQYRIYRAKNDLPFILYKTLDSNTSNYSDEEIILGNIYKYKMIAVLKGDIKTEMTKEISVKY